MDRERFDALARLFATTRSRRGALGALLSAALLGASPDALAGPGQGRGKGHAKRRGKGKDKGNGNGKHQRRNRDGKVRTEQVPANCCSTNPCTPGPGKNLGKCCFEDAILAGQNFKGANLGSANLSGATLTNANFKGANLDKACLVDANLTGATIDGSTNTGGAIFCRTTMPDGNENNSGCARGTRCCPTCDDENLCPDGEVCCGGRCRAGNCCINGQATTCADGETCCADGCADTETDPDNCGACGNACDPGVDCVGGECALQVILSGGPNPATSITVDDDLRVELNAVIIFNDSDGVPSVIPPIAFQAQNGDQLRVVATDVAPSCQALSPLYLHSSGGAVQTLDADGFPMTCPGSGGVFYDTTFTIAL